MFGFIQLIEVLVLWKFIAGLVICSAIYVFLLVSFIWLIFDHQKTLIHQRLLVKQFEEQYQKELLHASITSQEEERRRMAMDLHDDVGPLLAAAGFYLDSMDGREQGGEEGLVVKAREMLNMAIKQARRVTYNMTPYGIEFVGLEGSIDRMLQRYREAKKIETALIFHHPEQRLPLQQELITFRIVQELVTNIVKHSNTTFIRITQQTDPPYFYIRLRHNGNGLTQSSFDSLQRATPGMGLKNISSRIQLLNGKILFEKNDIVYTIHIRIPLPAVRINDKQTVPTPSLQ